LPDHEIRLHFINAYSLDSHELFQSTFMKRR
jgi:hypothetical protein